MPNLIDQLRTRHWFYTVAQLAQREASTPAAPTAYALERRFEPEGFKVRDGETIRRNKWRSYEKGVHVPNRKLVQKIDEKLPGSAAQLNHLLWQVLKAEMISDDDFESYIALLSKEVQRCVAAGSRAKFDNPSRRFQSKFSHVRFRKLSHLVSLDSLTCLLLLLKRALQGSDPAAFFLALGATKMLVMLTCDSLHRTVAESIFRLVQDVVTQYQPLNGLIFEPLGYSVSDTALQLVALAKVEETLKKRCFTADERTLYLKKLFDNGELIFRCLGGR